MATAAELLILFSLQDNATPGIKGVHGELGKTTAIAAAAGAAMMGLAGVMSDLARENAADVASLKAVQIAVENTGVAWGDAEGPMAEYINRMRDTAAIADDKMKPALAALVAVTGDYEKSMNLASLAADLARGKSMDLETASTLVGKVAMGNTSILKRYGITLAENATAEEALAELQKRFAGQAEAYGQTTKGQMEALSNRFADMREDLGGVFGAAQPVLMMMPGLSAGWTALGGALGGTTGKLLLNTVAHAGSRIALGLGAVATTAMTAAQWLLNAAMTANPIGIIIVALAALTAGVIWAWNNVDWFREGITAIWEACQDWVWILGALIGPLGLAAGAIYYAYKNSQDFRDMLDKLWAVLQTAIAGVLKDARTAFDNLGKAWDSLVKLATGAANFVATLKTTAFDTARVALAAAWTTIGTWTATAAGFVATMGTSVFDAAKTAIEASWKTIKDLAAVGADFLVGMGEGAGWAWKTITDLWDKVLQSEGVQNALDIGANLVEGIGWAWGEIVKLWDQATSSEGVRSLLDIGANLVEGAGWVWQTIVDFWNTATSSEGVRNLLDIGANLVAGAGWVWQTIVDFWNIATSNMSKVLDMGANLVIGQGWSIEEVREWAKGWTVYIQAALVEWAKPGWWPSWLWWPFGGGEGASEVALAAGSMGGNSMGRSLTAASMSAAPDTGYGTGGGGNTYNITVTGNTLLGDDLNMARELARILAPQLGALVTIG